jgi:predicted O-methyltransferase YrrM
MFSVVSAIRPVELRALVVLARGRKAVFELGTGTGWSTIALALADNERRVVSYDPVVRHEREKYFGMVPPGVRERIELREEPDTSGPRQDEAVEMLFIDSSHDRESLTAAFQAWRNALTQDAIVAFHDYEHPDYPGVREAIHELELAGEQKAGIFAWRPST